jgi:nucleoside diphosphate kinase
MSENKFKLEIPETTEIQAGSVEVVSTPDERLAVCVIKPDAFQNRKKIIRCLENSGLYIVQHATRELSDRFVVGVMYSPDEFPKPVAEATQRHFAEGPSEVLLVQGDDVVQKLLKAVGMTTAPSECDPETIRYIYGDHIPVELEQGLKYHRNAAHRPKTPEEAMLDKEKFRGLY